MPAAQARAGRSAASWRRHVRPPLAVGFGADEKQADDATRQQQAAQDDVAALVACHGRGGFWITAPMASGAITPAKVTMEVVIASMAARCGCGVSWLTTIGVTT